MRCSNKLLRIVTLLCLSFSLSVNASPPYKPDLVADGNKWTITFFNDAAPGHTQWATQTLCFFYNGTVGSHQRYRWVSISYPDWNGNATQEGDQIFMHGDFRYPFSKIDGGHDAMQWEIVSRSKRNLGAGHWQEWIENGRFGASIGFGNATFNRIGRCQYASSDDAIDANRNATFLSSDSEGKTPGGLMFSDIVNDDIVIDDVKD